MADSKKITALPHPLRARDPYLAALRKNVPQFRDRGWFSRFSRNPMGKLAHLLEGGKRVVTDMDFTLYDADAAYVLMDAGFRVGMFPPVNVGKYQDALRAFAKEKAFADPGQEGKRELRFYQEIYRIFSGLRYQDLVKFSRRIWFEGIPEFNQGIALHRYIYPEMAYFLALASREARLRKDLGVAFVSASPDFALLPFFELAGLPVKRLRSMVFERDRTGRLTGEITQVVFGESKVNAATEIFKKGWDVAFGDSLTNDRYYLGRAAIFAGGVGPRIRVMDGKNIIQEDPYSQVLTALPIKPPAISSKNPLSHEPPMPTLGTEESQRPQN